jgi:hypothetical protein
MKSKCIAHPVTSRRSDGCSVQYAARSWPFWSVVVRVRETDMGTEYQLTGAACVSCIVHHASSINVSALHLWYQR